MKTPTLSLPLKITMFVCVIYFLLSSLIFLSSFPVLLAIIKMAPPDTADYKSWLMLAGLAMVPLFCSLTFSQMLVRRSLLAARVFVAGLLAVQVCAVIVGWSEIGSDDFLVQASIAGLMLGLVLLFVALSRPQWRELSR